MFESLSDRLGGVFDKLKRRAALSEADVDSAAREIRVALLEADVALPVVKDFIARVKEKAVGEEVVRSISPAQMVIKIVNDELTAMLGSDTTDLNIGGNPPVPVLMVGLQGSGKTTSTAKIALKLKQNQRKKVLMASLDVRRPAAQEQLRVLGEQIDVRTLPIVAGEQPAAITKRAMTMAKLEGFDVLMLDTAGRLSIDEQLMAEVAEVRDIAQPHETLLVADSLTGQDAVNTAKAFNDRVPLSGIVLTRIDGDGRGGAALSMRAVTGCPIKLMGTGEKIEDLEVFHPSRIANRILGMGDIVSLVERASEHVKDEDAAKLAKKLKKGSFDLNDMKKQFEQLTKMGGLQSMLKMLPGGGKMMKQLASAKVDEKTIAHQIAIINSMTPKERERPEVIKASRKKRVAAGYGRTVQEVNKLLKQFTEAQRVMKRMSKMGKKGGLPGGMGGMPEGFDPSMLDGAGGGDAMGADPKALADLSKSLGGKSGGLMGGNSFPTLGNIPSPFGKKK